MGDKPINVLLIEDSPGDARLIREFLAEKGGGQFRLEWADHLEEGLRHLDAGHVDLVLLDLSLPQSEGLDTLAVVLGHAPRVPTIVLTVLNDEAVAVEAVRRGAQDYLIKRQTDGVVLVRAARYAIERNRAERELAAAKTRLQEANRRLEELATTDDLTGLANRRRFMEVLKLEVERSRRHGSNLALVMIDIDGFKAINDAYGHAFGDRVLVEVAKALQGDARVTDLAARYGGDEFMVLMPETRVEEALGAVERMRKRIAERPVSDGKRTLPISVSAGISAAEADRTATSDTLIHLADEAMYAAKYAGGNATRTWKQITRDQAEEVSEEAARVEDPRRHLARGKR